MSANFWSVRLNNTEDHTWMAQKVRQALLSLDDKEAGFVDDTGLPREVLGYCFVEVQPPGHTMHQYHGYVLSTWNHQTVQKRLAAAGGHLVSVSKQALSTALAHSIITQGAGLNYEQKPPRIAFAAGTTQGMDGLSMYVPGKDTAFVNWDGTCDNQKALLDINTLGFPAKLRQRAVMLQAEAYYKERVTTYTACVPTSGNVPASVSGTPTTAVPPTTVTDTPATETASVDTAMLLAPAQEDVVMRVAISGDGSGAYLGCGICMVMHGQHTKGTIPMATPSSMERVAKTSSVTAVSWPPLTWTRCAQIQLPQAPAPAPPTRPKRPASVILLT